MRSTFRCALARMYEAARSMQHATQHTAHEDTAPQNSRFGLTTLQLPRSRPPLPHSMAPKRTAPKKMTENPGKKRAATAPKKRAVELSQNQSQPPQTRGAASQPLSGPVQCAAVHGDASNASLRRLQPAACRATWNLVALPVARCQNAIPIQYEQTGQSLIIHRCSR